MSAQNQAEGETRGTVENLIDVLKQASEGLTEEFGDTAGQAGEQAQQAGKPPAGKTWERDIGELIKSIRDSTDRLAESVRESAKSETNIADLLKDIHESTNKLADEVRGSAKREAIAADKIREIKERTDILVENIRESAGETEMQGKQGGQNEQKAERQLQDTGSQAEGTEGVSLGQTTGSIKTLVEYYTKSSETFQEEVTKTAKRLQRGIRK